MKPRTIWAWSFTAPTGTNTSRDYDDPGECIPAALC
jgi:hypothetical protein